MKQSLGKAEKLKSKIVISKLFEEGRILKSFPLKLVYLPLTNNSQDHQVAFSVPKRSFKLAVDRNYLKRLLREAYRKNKPVLGEEETPYALMFIYLGRKKFSLPELEKSIQKLLTKFREQE
ncbi:MULTISPECIES: ribonuclease P protein component [Mesonia]|uniref:Ribonuclease P protein component n=1 Tax=Mesonia oceanica TaxID=2687242 RepID=A0AC61Y2Y7_9FLAO|nr:MULTISPECIES: ribonuclease P protein component [Mesonia]MAN28577.1 ribonuclease P protein component [Mesonia sp.]MAQ41258.1 ribonuclease P protein component [Mesonia sp.]MBJ97357.1 ribonuclease P protein component [Flavobacteriaceae bacterium]VVU98831.1 Ribonuclease P protein component [Mesonia oceanica]|tara:strand:+ start:16099 stop:16461 length:363 start_codon:yes stop_codon:yes gene_type:complete